MVALGLITVARASNTMLNINDESGLPCLIPDFRGKTFRFSSLIMMLLVGLLQRVFIMLRYVPSIQNLIRAFIISRCWILSNAFSASIEMIMWFLSFLLLLWCITLIDLRMLNCPCDPRINPTWSCIWTFLCIAGFGLLIFCWGFLHLYSSKILACNFLFFVVSLSAFGIRAMVAS